MSHSDSHTARQFQTTQWSLVQSLKSGDEAARAQAMAELCRRYWPPVYAFLRSRGNAPDQAAELTQAFFSTVVLHRGLFERAQESRGHLRTLLLSCLANFVVDASRRESARQRHIAGFASIQPRELEAEERWLESEPDLTACAFDRRWAIAQIETSIQLCQEHFNSIGKPNHWSVFHRHVLAPNLSTSPPLPLEQLAAEHGFESGPAVAAAIQVVKRRLRIFLDQVVAEGVPDGDSIGDEVAHLKAVLAQRPD